MLVCDPTATIPTRHVLATAAAQNYGLATYRIRQPFDFAGRTGTIKLDVDLTNNGLGGWPALDHRARIPSPAPSFDWQERGSGPRNGVEIEFGTGWCNTPHTLEAIVYTFADYLQTVARPVVRLRDPARDDGARRAQPRRGLPHPDAPRGVGVRHLARRRRPSRTCTCCGRATSRCRSRAATSASRCATTRR